MTSDEQVQSSAARRTPDPLIDQSNFSVERLPGLAIVAEQFAESLNKGFVQLFRSESSTTVEQIESASAFETLNACQGRLAAILRCVDLDARALVIFDRAFVDALAHVTFGAKQKPASSRASDADRPVTRIENNLIHRVSQITAEALTAGLSGFTDAVFTLERLEVVAGAQILGRRDTLTIVTQLRFEAAGENGDFLAIIPQATLLPIRQSLSKDPTAETPPIDPRWSKQMQDGVSSALIPVNGVLEELEMTLGEISALAVGDVLNLRGDGAGKIRLESGGHNLFWCKLVQKEGRYLLQVEDPVQPEKGFLDTILKN
jgi:flagellar motor switch protein FliM